MFPISRWRVFTLHATLCAVVLAFLSIGSVISLPSAVQQNVSSDSILVTEVPIATSTSPTVANITSSSDEISVEMSTEIVSSTTTQSYDTVTIKCKSPSEVYSNCSNSCPASCEDPTRKPCRTFCWNGCECAPGYVKNHRWQCIPIDECPKCGANEHFRNCGANCEPSCDTYENVPVYCSNRASCKRGCFCNYGFVRDLNKNGTCVSISQCPQKCGANEYWDVNGEPCIRTALNPRPRCLFEAAKPACICNTGFRRNVNTKQCETLSPIADKLDIKCSGNETYSHCNSECARNCFDDQKRQMCQTICNRGCFCKEGYLRENSGRCVLPQDCQQWNSYSTPVWRV